MAHNALFPGNLLLTTTLQIANVGRHGFFMDPDFAHKKRADVEVLSLQSTSYN